MTEANGEIGTAYGVYQTQSWADTYGGNEDETFSHSLTTVFTITTSPGLQYDVSFNTQRIGALGLDDDTLLYSTVFSSAHLSVLTGTVNGSGDALLNLSATELDNGSTGTVAVNQTSSNSDYAGQVGTQIFTVVTTWTSRVTSNYDESGVSLGQDVDQLFLGLDMPANAGDGVFTNITVTVVSEPSTALLMGLGMAGLASVNRRSGDVDSLLEIPIHYPEATAHLPDAGGRRGDPCHGSRNCCLRHQALRWGAPSICRDPHKIQMWHKTGRGMSIGNSACVLA